MYIGIQIGVRWKKQKKTKMTLSKRSNDGNENSS